MTNIRRYHQKEDLVFLTHVTHNRAPILVKHIDLLKAALEKHLDAWHAKLVAWVVLPDHVHMLLDIRNSDLSSLMRKIKLTFSTRYRQRACLESGKIWQNRFWDHVIRDEKDMNRHIDYIHYNPVKHGLVKSPSEWAASSFSDFCARGHYEKGWGERYEIDASIDYGE